jgi:hypothetical protein
MCTWQVWFQQVSVLQVLKFQFCKFWFSLVLHFIYVCISVLGFKKVSASFAAGSEAVRGGGTGGGVLTGPTRWRMGPSPRTVDTPSGRPCWRLYGTAGGRGVRSAWWSDRQHCLYKHKPMKLFSTAGGKRLPTSWFLIRSYLDTVQGMRLKSTKHCIFSCHLVSFPHA